MSGEEELATAMWLESPKVLSKGGVQIRFSSETYSSRVAGRKIDWSLFSPAT